MSWAWLLPLLLALFLVVLWRELSTKACLNPRPQGYQPPPAFPESSQLRVLVLGDQGSGDESQVQVARAMEAVAAARGCDLVLLLGDNFIQQGIKDLDDPQIESKFEAMYRLDRPFYAVLGNHDFKGNWRAQIDLTQKLARWRMPGSTYFFEAGPVAFYGLNTTCSLCSILSLFKRTQKPWRIAFGHHPMVSTGRHGGMLGLEKWVIGKSGVQAYLSGHHHFLEHIELGNLDQITSGAGGTNLNETKERQHPGKKFYLLDHGFVWAKFTPTQASYHFFDKEAQERYQFSRSLA